MLRTLSRAGLEHTRAPQLRSVHAISQDSCDSSCSHWRVHGSWATGQDASGLFALWWASACLQAPCVHDFCALRTARAILMLLISLRAHERAEPRPSWSG